jgi:hypothetical protein
VREGNTAGENYGIWGNLIVCVERTRTKPRMFVDENAAQLEQEQGQEQTGVKA